VGKGLAVLALVMLATSARGEEAGLRDDALRVTLGASLDLASTEYALATCARCSEGNPIVRDRGTFYAMKGLTTAGAVLGCRHLRHSGHLKAARILSYAVMIAQAALAAHNIRQARRGR
jgi:hypothetical protein